MDRQITELYDEREVDKLRLSNKIWLTVVCVFAAVCLAACITLCCLTDVRNVQKIMAAVMIIAVVGGWFVIYVCVSVIAEHKHEIVHAQNMFEGERTEHTGLLTIGDQKLRIIGSITFVKVRLTDGDKTENLKVNVLKLGKLKDIKERVKLYAVHGYVVAFEVCNENN
ncbi:MAG: hypothetical protein ACI4MH_02745 [Candidatus Coproplasma sp.]